MKRNLIGYFASFLILILYSFPAVAFKDKGLKKGEAYVLAAYDFDSIGRIIFSEFKGDESFSIKYKWKNPWRLVKVKSGNYYLKSVVPGYQNVRMSHLDAPKNIEKTIKIEEGSVTYIGRWAISKKGSTMKFSWDVDTSFPVWPLLELKESRPWVVNYPLFVIKNGKENIRVGWD